LSRVGEELVLWSRSEVGFLQLGEAYTTGSSIMPQKRNPVIGELLRGRAGRVFGALMGLLTVVKGLPLAYNTDLQEDKEGTFDAIDTVAACLRITAEMLQKSEFRVERMNAAARGGYLTATDLADYLVAKGMPFRDAHRTVGRIVAAAAAKGVSIKEMPLDELQAVCPAIDRSVYALLTPESAVARRTSPLGTSPGQVESQLALAAELLAAPPGTVAWVAVTA
ncbi:MAG: argininosuccinate lyase, partial [Firmicutes bacterium]|nr:argininosuccinate lyase [Bacillota bacterium]